jgi:hypothetical protein
MPNGQPYPSGTAFELLTALEASKAKGVPDVYVFRKTADAMLPTTDAERRRQAQTQLDALEAFWSEWFKAEKGQFKAAFQSFGSTDAFEQQISAAAAIAILPLIKRLQPCCHGPGTPAPRARARSAVPAWRGAARRRGPPPCAA